MHDSRFLSGIRKLRAGLLIAVAVSMSVVIIQILE